MEIGRIKRKYAAGDFNPYAAMKYIYDNCLSCGSGHVVLVAGYSERFVADTIIAWHHVLASEGHTEFPIYHDKEITTHTGTRLRFVKFEDSTHAQMSFLKHCEEAKIVALCNKYSSAEMVNIIRETNRTKKMYDFSDNNK